MYYNNEDLEMKRVEAMRALEIFIEGCVTLYTMSSLPNNEKIVVKNIQSIAVNKLKKIEKAPLHKLHKHLKGDW